MVFFFKKKYLCSFFWFKQQFFLKSKKIYGAALDVMVQEPIKNDSPFLKQKNVILTPHTAGVTNKYWTDQYLLFSKNLARYKKSLKLINLKNSFNLKEGY